MGFRDLDHFLRHHRRITVKEGTQCTAIEHHIAVVLPNALLYHLLHLLHHRGMAGALRPAQQRHRIEGMKACLQGRQEKRSHRMTAAKQPQVILWDGSDLRAMRGDNSNVVR